MPRSLLGCLDQRILFVLPSSHLYCKYLFIFIRIDHFEHFVGLHAVAVLIRKHQLLFEFTHNPAHSVSGFRLVVVCFEPTSIVRDAHQPFDPILWRAIVDC